MCSSDLILRTGSHRSNKIKIPRKKFRLCHRDENGTFSFGDRVDKLKKLKTTPLYREKCMRLYIEEYNELVRRGMLTWEAYKEHRLTIENSLVTIRDSIRKYTERRLHAGLFYLVPVPDRTGIETRSHLYEMPIGEALRKRRREIRERKIGRAHV